MKLHKILVQSLLPVLTILGTQAFANGCENMPIGFHEFAIIGANNHVFISHYPMFSSVHSYQVLLEVELASDDHNAQQKFLDQLAAHPEIEYTYSPYRNQPPGPNRAKDQDDWVLPEKAHKGVVMNGDIHYKENQNDTTLDFNVRAKVVNVIQSRLMLPTDLRPSHLTYILFGDHNSAFLAHYISAPKNPGEKIADFDQILSVSVTGGQFQAGKNIYSIDDRSNDKSSRLLPGENATLVSSYGQRIQVKVLSEAFIHNIGTER